MSRNDAQFKLRLPSDLKAWLEEKAKENYHSMQAVILGLIVEAKKRDEKSER
ncbi:Arc family DNA-binding protein [Pseudomonas rhizoryzae]|uniref:Arc family DNA-binding protein n=1 Tax=Pseudomonas rhizoryzae TaxID=2571129 RepID=UPI0010C18D72|nr:Arc family DNA-binding protein [Pseudomonas rhizoryzae]